MQNSTIRIRRADELLKPILASGLLSALSFMHIVGQLLWLGFLSTLPFCLSLYHQHQSTRSELFGIASLESSFVSNLPRSMGGRIENAFAAAKERHEAAFVTFVTAGYPSAKGERKIDRVEMYLNIFLTCFLNSLIFKIHLLF